jgi:hypothetical protein
MLVHLEHRVHRHQAVRSGEREKMTGESGFAGFVRGCRTGAEAQPSQCVRVVYSGSGQVHTTQQQPVMSSDAAGAWADRAKIHPFLEASRGVFAVARICCCLYQHQSERDHSNNLIKGST